MATHDDDINDDHDNSRPVKEYTRDSQERARQGERTLASFVVTRASSGGDGPDEQRDGAAIETTPSNDVYVSKLARQTATEAAFVPAHLVPEGTRSIGQLFAASGLRASVFASNVVETAPGAVTTFVPRGVLIRGGAYYYEVEVLQSSSGGQVCIGWVSTRWTSTRPGAAASTDAHVGDLGSWGITTSLQKRDGSGEMAFVPRRMLVAGSIPEGSGVAHEAGTLMRWPNPPEVFIPRS